MQLAWLFTLSESGSGWQVPIITHGRAGRAANGAFLVAGSRNRQNPNSAESEPDPNFERPESTG